ncbi:unnamed protein product [Zymoseptoria tritici ST99CH_1A5]|uniref:Granulins domain-containing protein n=2 Tax=Zymoseptoria tritici TaxID=1047171 RepID=A0A2H1G5C7_ZYMTR|nr:unnamed protein product [Zymoseptoria tritici ST99CH_1E4]SMR49952.1 unnamed protein product [Zymoseptoria tritici ST99CH_3D1]SMY22653.1 unnamed protein product [Zymoseptoria tritici ST99CH_1A5]
MRFSQLALVLACASVASAAPQPPPGHLFARNCRSNDDCYSATGEYPPCCDKNKGVGCCWYGCSKLNVCCGDPFTTTCDRG